MFCLFCTLQECCGAVPHRFILANIHHLCIMSVNLKQFSSLNLSQYDSHLITAFVLRIVLAIASCTCMKFSFNFIGFPKLDSRSARAAFSIAS